MHVIEFLHRYIMKSPIGYLPPFGGSYYTLNDTTYFAVLDYLGLGKPILERATDMSVTAYLEAKIWHTVGMEFDASWSLDGEASGFEKMAPFLLVSPARSDNLA